MNKLKLMSIVLIISLIFGIYNCVILNSQKKYANEEFAHCLREASSCYEMDFEKLDQDDKDSYFIKAASNLHTAMEILPFTSYAKVENKTNSANGISRLYLVMAIKRTPQSTNRLRAVTEKRVAIFKCLDKMSLDPYNKSNWQSLSKIAQDIGY